MLVCSLAGVTSPSTPGYLDYMSSPEGVSVVSSSFFAAVFPSAAEMLEDLEHHPNARGEWRVRACRAVP